MINITEIDKDRLLFAFNFTSQKNIGDFYRYFLVMRRNGFTDYLNQKFCLLQDIVKNVISLEVAIEQTKNDKDYFFMDILKNFIRKL